MVNQNTKLTFDIKPFKPTEGMKKFIKFLIQHKGYIGTALLQAKIKETSWQRWMEDPNFRHYLKTEIANHLEILKSVLILQAMSDYTNIEAIEKQLKLIKEFETQPLQISYRDPLPWGTQVGNKIVPLNKIPQ